MSRINSRLLYLDMAHSTPIIQHTPIHLLVSHFSAVNFNHWMITSQFFVINPTCQLSMSIEHRIKRLNKWDIYPCVSTLYSGPLRIFGSAIQIVAGTIFLIVAIFFGWINDLDTWRNDIITNVIEIAHGLGNLARGATVSIPGLGNLIIFLYENTL